MEGSSHFQSDWPNFFAPQMVCPLLLLLLLLLLFDHLVLVAYFSLLLSPPLIVCIEIVYTPHLYYSHPHMPNLFSDTERLRQPEGRPSYAPADGLAAPEVPPAPAPFGMEGEFEATQLLRI